MKIKIKILGLGYNDYYQASILIYDTNNNLIINKKTYNGIIEVELKKDNLYKLVIQAPNEIKENNIYIGNNNYYCFFLKSNLININNQTITFQLTDYFYDNLKIERGEIILWPK